MKIDQHEPQETKVNHNRPKSTATGQGEPQETRVPLVVTMNHSVLFGVFGSGIFGWCFGTLWSLVASLAGVLVHFGHMVRLFTTQYGLCGMPFE